MLHDPSRQAPALRPAPQERSFRSHDGAQIVFRFWPAAAAAAKGAVILLHRGHEHGGRMAHLVESLDLPDFAFYAWDARGHGRSPGERGAAPSFGAIVRDLDCFARHLGEADGVAAEDMAVVAQSVGAVAAAAWAHDYAPRLRALVLAAPAFSVKLYVPFARTGLRLLQRLRGPFKVKSYVTARALTQDPERIRSFEADPLIARPIASNVLLDLGDTAARVVADARAIQTPVQLLISGDDWVVRQGPQHRFFENLGSRIKERRLLPGFRHDTFGEARRAEAIALSRGFLLRAFSAPFLAPDLSDAHLAGFTRDEKDRLETPLAAWSPRGLYWRAVRASLRLGAHVSEGLRIGRDTGFDSGSTLDHVYRDKPEGRGPLGRLIDRLFLDAIGWRGIRARKDLIEVLLLDAFARLDAAGRPARVLDIAAGHGRYVLDAAAAAGRMPAGILLRDWSPRNVEAGRRLIAERGLSDIARFERGDAFDRDALASIEPEPTLAVVSGLYELFDDNEPVRRSLAGLADALPQGGLLLYTNQPWHPQIELIARALSSHRGGRPWVMRRRSQAEMDQLVAGAGFRKIETRLDPWGMFSVSLAERV